MLSRFKWYRKLMGGIWYKNRYIYDMGRSVAFYWERTKGNTTGGFGSYNVGVENYTKSNKLPEYKNIPPPLPKHIIIRDLDKDEYSYKKSGQLIPVTKEYVELLSNVEIIEMKDKALVNKTYYNKPHIENIPPPPEPPPYRRIKEGGKIIKLKGDED